MARLTLNNEGGYASGTITVFGTKDGHEDVTIVSGAHVTLLGGFEQGGDTIHFSGDAADYTVVRSGTTIVFTDDAGTTVSLPVSPNGVTTIVFDDATFDAGYADGDVFIGDQVVTTTPDTVGGGSSGGGEGEIFNITVTAEADVVEGAGDLVFRLERPSDEASEAVTLNVATVGGTATAGQDYTPVSQQVTFSAGQTTQFVVVHVTNDSIREDTETVTLQVTSPDGTETIATASGNILDNLGSEPPVTPQSFELTTGADTVEGGAGNDRISGVQNILFPGKLLSSADIIDGGDGLDTLILINAHAGGDQALVDMDLSNVSNVEAIQTNYDAVTLGAEAAAAGIVTVDTSLNTTGGTTLDISSAGMTNSLNVTMADNQSDVVITDLAIGGDTIDTGVNSDGGSNIDLVQFANQTTGVSVSFDGAAVGDGAAADAEGSFGVAVQSLDADGDPTGAVTYTDDEGIAFQNAAGITVTDGDTVVGTFNQVLLGTANDDSVGVNGYANGGGGDDALFGGATADWLVGGAGDDVLDGSGGADHLLGGEGDDYLDGGLGLDVMDGGAGSDTYHFDNGEFLPAEAITDTGEGADDVDTLDVYSTTNLTDAQFAGKMGFEALTAYGMANVTLDTVAEGSGIRSVDLTGSFTALDASGYTSDLSVHSYGDVATGSGDDDVHVAFSVFAARTYDLGDGDDVLVEDDYYNISDGSDTIHGGDGYDTLVLGGEQKYFSGTVTEFFNTSMMDGVESIVVRTGFDAIADPDFGDEAGIAASYVISIDPASVEAGESITVDGSGLRTGIVTDLGADNLLGTADDVADDETLTVDGSFLGADQSLVATGGAGDDMLIGGAGDDTLTGGAGDDTLTGGAGDDTLDGGEGSDLYVYADGEFTADEALNDSGAAGTDVIDVTSTTAITDAMFAGKSGIEQLNADVTLGAGFEVTIGQNAQAAGIRIVESGAGDLDATAYTEGLTVTGSGDIRTGSGADTINVTGGGSLVRTASGDDVVNLEATAGGTSDIGLGQGDDVLNGGNMVDATDYLHGDDGYDTLVLDGPGTTGTYSIAFLNRFSGFEQIDVMAGDAATAAAVGTAQSYDLTLSNGNVNAGGTLTIDGSDLRAGVVTGFGGDGALGGGDDTTTDETLTLDGSAVTGGSLHVTGGAGDDMITGGAKADMLSGGAGDDVLAGGAGNDVLDGGDGDDVIIGGAGADIMHGGDGDDLFAVNLTQFNSEQDEVFGDAGTNTLAIDGGGSATANVADVGFNGRYHDVTNVLLSNGSFTWVAGAYSEDAGVEQIEIDTGATGNVSIINFTHDGTTLIGADGNDTFTGSAFADTFFTGEGDNVVNAGAGNDMIHLDDDAAAGLQTINAGAGDDTIYGGNNVDAADVLNGGAGNDTLVLGYANDGVNTFTNVDFSGGNLTNVETVHLTSGYDADAMAGQHAYSLTFGDANVGASGVLTVDSSDLTDASGEFAQIFATGLSVGNSLHVTGGDGQEIVFGGNGADVLTLGAGDDTAYGLGGNDTIDVGAGADFVNGGAGRDTISLGADSDQDYLQVGSGESARANYDTVSGFVIDGDDTAGLQGTAYDVIDFGTGIMANSATLEADGILDGFVQNDSALYDAIQSSTSVLAAVQLVEQELNTDPAANTGVLAFEYHGNTYIGDVSDPGGTGPATFNDIVQLTGVVDGQHLVVDAGTALGLSA